MSTRNFICAIALLFIHGLENERLYKLNNVVLLPEKPNKCCLFTTCSDEISNYTVYKHGVSFKITDVKLKIGY